MTAGLIKQLHLLPSLGTFAVPAVCDSPQRDPWQHSRSRAGGCKLDCKRSRVSKSSPGSAGGSPPFHLLCSAGWHCPGHGSHVHCTEIPPLFCPESPKQCCCGSTFHRGTLSSMFSAVLVWGVYLTWGSGAQRSDWL